MNILNFKVAFDMFIIFILISLKSLFRAARIATHTKSKWTDDLLDLETFVSEKKHNMILFSQNHAAKDAV